MPIESVKIPQNVYVEDRIIGPITLRQIMIVMISIGISYAIWATMKANGAVTVAQTVIAWTPTFIGSIFAFVKINGISLLRIVFLSIERLDKPAKRIWMPRQGIYVNIVTKPPKEENTQMKKKKEQKGNAKLEELSRLLDKGPSEDEQQTTAEPETKKPVKRGRIQAEKRKKPVDDIAPPEKNNGSLGGNLMRDINPPPSHA